MPWLRMGTNGITVVAYSKVTSAPQRSAAGSREMEPQGMEEPVKASVQEEKKGLLGPGALP